MHQGQLFEVAGAIADGVPIDWAAVDLRATSPAPDLTLPARIVERIAQIHAELPAARTFATLSLHKSLAALTLPGDATAPPDTPITWGPLTIDRKIGHGTFGEVYRAHDRRLNRTVALKLLRRMDRRESAVIEEGQLLARVRHPNVVTVYGAERIEGRVGLWMQYVDGPTLDQEVKARGAFAPAEVVQAGVQLAQALGAVHQAGLLHRDVKAQNALRDGDGRVLLTDFGTGREVTDATNGNGGRELAGTPVYMAPEVLGGAPASVASDIYSLGVLLYYLATGTFPVTGRSRRELADAHARGGRVDVRTARPGVPRRLAAVIDRATDPDPNRRYASAADLEAALGASTGRALREAAWIAAVLILAVTSVIVVQKWRRTAAASRSPLPAPDFVLVSRFDNRTGDTSFDGGIEYTIAQELGRSDAIEVVPTERVIEALQLMKRPIETVVDRTLAREICLRDGQVKAFVTGRIEKAPDGYAITADLVDPADGAVVSSITDSASTATAVLPTITRDATRLGDRFSDQRARIKGAVPLERVSTPSLRALQLYNEALRLGEFDDEGAAEAASINERALAEDPSFAAAWIFKAWLLRQMKPPGQEDNAARRAVALAEDSPEWERRYIRGLAQRLAGKYAGAVRDLEAAVRLRPDFEPAWEFLSEAYLVLNNRDAAVTVFKSIADQRPFDILANARAAFNIVYTRENPDEARPYIDRLDELLTLDRSSARGFYWAKWWRTLLPAYEAWKSGDLAAARSVVDRAAAEIPLWPENERPRSRQIVGLFYITLGRLHDAERVIPNYDLSFLAEARDDLPAQRRLLLEGSPNEDAYIFVNAGLISQARARLQMDRGGADDAINDIGRGALELATGTPEKAISLLRTALTRAPFFGKSYQDTCKLLTTALFRVGRRTEAITELERCSTVLPRFAGNFYATTWMKNLLRLADEYRVLGRIDDAHRIEQRLRTLLIYADADNPLVVRLNAR